MQIIIRIVVIAIFLLPAGGYAKNQLAGHDSPYLAMHGEDPVNWQAWSAEVMVQAKKENKLLFVSIGYFACHWCHVMQRESYQNEQVAKILNENFISVKIDRELNPAIDAFLIDFVTRTRGAAGWPLNVFLTPDGHPLLGMTYLPKDRFMTLLEGLQQQWKQSPDYFRKAAARAANEIEGKAVQTEADYKKEYGKQYQTILLQQAMSFADEMSGGFGEQTKFPMVPQLNALLSIYSRLAVPQLKTFLLLTLDNMATQGLRDHLGGGFYRYTVDPGWQTPHFEKMLYDNALLASLYLRAAKLFQRRDYEMVARDTLDFMLNELMRPNGGMVASLSAVDEAGVEGAYYLWQVDSLENILNSDERNLIQLMWGIQGETKLEAGHHAIEEMSVFEAATQLAINHKRASTVFEAAKKKLLAVRVKRDLPVDVKQLAAWNGLALLALVEAAQLSDGEKYRQAAQQIRNLLVNSLWDGNRLWRAKGKSGEIGQAGLEDYAFAAQGLWAWAELIKESNEQQSKNDLRLVKRWVDDAWRRFHSVTGWKLSDQTLLPTGYGVPLLDEGPLPSPSAVLLRISMLVAKYNDDQRLLIRAQKALEAGHSQLKQAAFDYPGQVILLLE